MVTSRNTLRHANTAECTPPPWQLLAGTHARCVLPPFDCAGDTWERVDDVSILAPWQLGGGGGGQAAAGREVRSALWGAEGWRAGIRKRNGALCYSPSYFHRRLNQPLSWYRTLKFYVLRAFGITELCMTAC